MLGELNLDMAMGVLRQLTPEERVIVGLYFYEQLPISEIGKILSRKEGYVTSVLKRVITDICKLTLSESPLDQIATEMIG